MHSNSSRISSKPSLRRASPNCRCIYQDASRDHDSAAAAYRERLARLIADVEKARGAGIAGRCRGIPPAVLSALSGPRRSRIAAVVRCFGQHDHVVEIPDARAAAAPGAGRADQARHRQRLFSPALQLENPYSGMARTSWIANGFVSLDITPAAERDAETLMAEKLCDRFVQGPLSLDAWRRTILQDAPDVLLYPETGMDKTTVQLAAQRLANVQCCSWGHPVTSGLPTMDYFLSSELMEPAGAAAHYSEQLIRLPNLSIYYQPAEVSPVAIDRSQLGLRASAVAYWCGQSLPKYLPQFDQVFCTHRGRGSRLPICLYRVRRGQERYGGVSNVGSIMRSRRWASTPGITVFSCRG